VYNAKTEQETSAHSEPIRTLSISNIQYCEAELWTN